MVRGRTGRTGGLIRRDARPATSGVPVWWSSAGRRVTARGHWRIPDAATSVCAAGRQDARPRGTSRDTAGRPTSGPI